MCIAQSEHKGLRAYSVKTASKHMLNLSKYFRNLIGEDLMRIVLTNSTSQTFMRMPTILVVSAHWYEGLRRWGPMSVSHPRSWRSGLSVMRQSRCTMQDPLLTLHQLGQCTVMAGRGRWGSPWGEGVVHRLPYTSRARA